MKTFLTGVVALSIAAFLSLNCFGQSYQLTDLGTQIGPNSYAQGINNQGQVVGYWDTTNGAHAFLYQAGTMTDLGLLGLGTTNGNYALSVNNLGQVVGFSLTTNGSRAFLYQNGAIANLGSLGGLGSYAFGINGNGQIVGYIDTTNGARAILYGDGEIINIGTLGGTNSYAYGINNALQVAGSSLLGDNATTHAFLWQNGVINDLNQYQAYNSGWQLADAHGIDDLGNIVGWGVIQGQEHAYVISSSGVATDLGVLTGGTNSYALGLNNSNQVVGASSTASGTHAVLWQNGVANDLNNLINVSGWELKEACGINDFGQIVGWGVIGGQVHAFLLTQMSQTPEVSTGRALMADKTLASPNVLPPSGSLTISITNPVNNAIFSSPTNLTINTSIADSAGTVTQVLFYVGGSNLLGMSTNSPFSFIWTNPPVGVHALTAVAMDNASLVATSSVVVVSIATNLMPIADAHVRDGSSTNINFGTTNVMECLTTTTNGNNRDIYFKFSLTGITNVSSAQLRVFGWISSTNSITNTVYSVTNTSWTETGITWSNKPARVTALFTNKVTGTNWISYDISSYVKAQLAAGQSVVSVALHDPTNSSLLLSVYSKENTSNTPALLVVTTNSTLSVTLTNLPTPISGVVGFWTFDNNVQLGHDSSTNGSSLTTSSGSPVYSTNGMFGGALYLNGSSTLTTPSFPAGLPTGGTPYTIALWEKTASGCSAQGGFIGWGNNYGGNCNNFRLNGSSSLDNYWWANDFVLSGLSVNPMDGNWHAVIAAYDGTNRVMYVDGVNVGSSASSGLNAAADNFIVGATTGGPDFTGWIDNLLVANRAFTTADVSSYQSNSVVPYVVPAGSNVNLGASASDTDSTVTQVQFFQGTTSLGIVTSSPYVMTWTNPAPGTYAVTAVASDTGGFTATSSVVNIVVDSPPSVTLTNPANNAVVPVGSNVNLGVSVSDADGTVAQVQFFQGTNILGSATSPPYSLVWSNVPAGTFTLTAVATDNNNLNTTSSPVSLIVDIPPVVSITSPANNALILAVQTNVTVTAAASDADGSVVSVQFFQGTTSLGTVTTAPYSLVWSNVTAGNYSLTAVAVDNNGLSTVSPAVGFTVTPFQVAITNPVNNTLFAASQTNLTLAAIATDVSGTITQVQFFQGSTSLGIATSSPYDLTWNNASPGNYDLVAIATDNNGNTATSSVVNITITPLFTTNTMTLWLKADAISGLTNSAGVGTWPDSSGWTNNATQSSSGNQPMFETNALNGYPVVQFVGANQDYLKLPYFMNGATQGEAFVVLKTTTPPGGYGTLWSLGNFTLYLGANTPPQYPNSDGSISDDFGSPNIHNIGVPAQPLSQYHVFEVTSQTNDWAAWINGILQYQTLNNTVQFGNEDLNLGQYFFYFSGDVAEVLIFNRGLTGSERVTVNGYLNGKYRLVPAVPAAPTNLIATAISPSQIGLTWDEALNGGATQIAIERSTSSNGVYQIVAQIADATSYVDTNLTAGTTYYYQVQAINVAQWSPASNLAQAATPVTGMDIPFGSLQLWLKADSGLLQRSTNTLVNIWADQSGNGNNATQPTQASQPTWVPSSIGDRPVVQFNGTNSYLSLPYFMNGATQGEAFVVLKTTTPPGGYGTLWSLGNFNLVLGANTPPQYPNSDGSISDDFGSPNIYNIGVPAQPLSQYHMFEVTSQTNDWAAWINGILQYQTLNNTVQFGNEDLNLGQYFFYFSGDVAEVLIFNRGLAPGERNTIGNYLNEKYNLVNPTNAPASAPTNVVATAGTNQISVTWSNTSTALAEIQIERKTDSNGVYSVIAELKQGTTNYLDSGLPSGHWYFYRLRAANLAGYSPYSASAGALLDQPPTVSLNTPTNGTIFISPAAIPLSATATNSDGTMPSVSFYSGTNYLGTVTNSPYNFTWSGVLHGSYTLTALATDDFGLTSTSALVTITVSNIPPNVSLTAPTNGEFYWAPAVITLTASAGDPNGTVARVDFYSNGTNWIGTTNAAPYTINWTNLSTGNYSLTAVATDNEGATSASSAVTIAVSNTPPTISILTPTNNTVFQAGATVPITVNASDANGYVAKVDYYYGGTNFIGETTVSPFSFFWPNVPAGTYTLTAAATDNGGAVTTSSGVSLKLNAPPSVSITNPVNNATFVPPTNITIYASASDSDGTVSRVDFYYGLNNFIGSVTNAPYKYVLTNAPPGNFPLTARATDNQGGVTTSTPVYVTVASNLTDVADSYVRDGIYSTTNYGTATNLLVETNSTSGNNCDTYFKFDTTHSPNITSAVLNFYAAVSVKRTTIGFMVCGTGTNWTESGITWSNRPALGGSIGGTNISVNTFGWYSIDVTSYLRAQQAAGSNVVSLALHATNTASANVIIYSKEIGTNQPYLQIYASNQPPVVTITSPTNNSLFIPSTNVTITASASDLDGKIYQVQFFEGTTSLGIVTNGSSFSVTWTNVPFGLYTLTAVATDNYGAQTTSSPVSYNADPSFYNLDPEGDGLTYIEEWQLGLSTQTNNSAVIGTGLIQIHTPLK